jgi:hypothetical protein
MINPIALFVATFGKQNGDPLMSQSLSRRKLIGAGAAVALTPTALSATTANATTTKAKAAPPATLTGPMYVLIDPLRVFDSRSAPRGLGGGRLSTGNSVGVPFGLPVAVVSDGAHSPSAVYINITITDTQGVGYLVVRASDPTGEKPLPPTSNLNWWANGQTLCNMSLIPIGDETYIQIYAGGAGSTHVIIDLQAYIPNPA